VTDRLLAASRDAAFMVTVSEPFDWAPRPTHRGTSNTNERGSAADRRRRKQWLIDTYGNGFTVGCRWCHIQLDFGMLTVDRIVPGCRGGRYTRDNIAAACGPCNSRHGGGLRA
jgi:5-methylcytosine-specific restriction endonuclease McrA